LTEMMWKSNERLDPNGKGPIGRTMDILVRFLCQQQMGALVNEKFNEYYNLFAVGTQVTTRNAAYARMVDSFYELVTDFYEWGWGAS
jgi:hypothetical protein